MLSIFAAISGTVLPSLILFLCHRLFSRSVRFFPDAAAAAAAPVTVAFYFMLNFILSRVFHVLFISYCVAVSVLNSQLLDSFELVRVSVDRER